MFENGQYENVELNTISEKWMKGQAFKKESMIDGGCNPCIHYGELFTKYGAFIDEAISRTDADLIRSSCYGDILFPASDVTPDGLTKCSTILQNDVVLGGDIIIFRPCKGNNSIYLSYAIRMQKEQLLSRVTGAVVRHISAKSLQTVSIPLPPLERQNQFELLLRQSDKSKYLTQKTLG